MAAMTDTVEMVECPGCGRREEMYADRDSDLCPECYLDENDN